MKQTLKKLLCFSLVFLIAFSLLSFSSFAADSSRDELYSSMKDYSSDVASGAKAALNKSVSFKNTVTDTGKSYFNLTFNGHNVNWVLKVLGLFLSNEEKQELEQLVNAESVVNDLFSDTTNTSSTVRKCPSVLSLSQNEIKDISVDEKGSYTVLTLSLNPVSPVSIDDTYSTSFGRAMPVLSKDNIEQYRNNISKMSSKVDGMNVEKFDVESVKVTFTEGSVTYYVNSLTGKMTLANYSYKADVSVKNAALIMSTPEEDISDSELSTYLGDKLTIGVDTKLTFSTTVEVSQVYSDFHNGSDPVQEKYVAPSCTSDGSYDSVIYCTSCEQGEILWRDKVNVPALPHTPQIISEGYPATCTQAGLSDKVICSVCENLISDQTEIPALGHDYSDWSIVDDATCTETGYKEKICSRCGDVVSEEIPLKSHTWGVYVSPATVSSDGSKTTYSCVNCGVKRGGYYNSKTTKIPKISSVTLSKTKIAYTGKALKPTVTVKDSAGNVIPASEYTLSYKNNKNIGTASVTVSFKGNYSGEVTKNFKIVLAKVGSVSASSVKTASLKLTWSKVEGAAKYQIYKSADNGKSFKLLKTVSSLFYTDKSLKAGGSYQYKVRAVASDGKTTGSFSSVLKIGTLTSAPAISLKKKNAKTVTVSWKKVTGAKSYIVYKSTNGKSWSKVGSTSKLSYSVTKLTPGKKVYIKVRVLNNYGKYSSFSSVKSIKPA